METTPLHPLVAKKAAEWVAFAEKYGVKTTLEPMDGHWSGSVTINFDTGLWMDRGCVLIYVPTRRGRTVRQQPLIMGYRKTTGGKIAFRADPTATLRRLRDRIMWSWSPTADERLRDSIAATRAAVARHNNPEATK